MSAQPTHPNPTAVSQTGSIQTNPMNARPNQPSPTAAVAQPPSPISDESDPVQQRKRAEFEQKASTFQTTLAALFALKKHMENFNMLSLTDATCDLAGAATPLRVMNPTTETTNNRSTSSSMSSSASSFSTRSSANSGASKFEFASTRELGVYIEKIKKDFEITQFFIIRLVFFLLFLGHFKIFFFFL